MRTTTATFLLLFLAGLSGLLAGSFANVAIARWPVGGSVTRPRRSHCPSCGVEIAARDNVPIVSWIALRGSCRQCRTLISCRYPLIELATGTLFAAVVAVWRLDFALPAFLTLSWSLVVATVIDLEHRIIPNRLTYPLPAVLFVLLLGATFVDGNWSDLRRGLLYGVVLPASVLTFSELFRLVRGKSGMGMGDIKLLASIGLVVGYLGGYEVIVFAYGTLATALVVVSGLLLTGRAGMATRIPFGPYLAAGAMIAVLFGQPLGRAIERYLALG